MTGPEHYRAAEAALENAANVAEYGDPQEVYHLRCAQVHATLALAAATALASYGDMPLPDSDVWIDAASAYKPPVELNGGAS